MSSMHNFRISVDGRSYNVVVEDLGQSADAGHPATAAPAPIVHAAPAAVVHAAPVAASPSAAPAVAGAGSVVAPLGGVVNSIDVPLGRDVAIGDRVATIEAMKMKTEVRAKFAGKVTNIAVKANDSVETGQVLMTVG
jgi:glutaconyl-CoA/methylmalonyl-CoA decarboxylase subunit gamma